MKMRVCVAAFLLLSTSCAGAPEVRTVHGTGAPSGLVYVESDETWAFGVLVSPRHVLSSGALLANDVPLLLDHAARSPRTVFRVRGSGSEERSSRVIAVDVQKGLALLLLDRELPFSPRTERASSPELGEELEQWTRGAPNLSWPLGFDADFDVSASAGRVIAATPSMLLVNAGTLGDRRRGALFTDRQGRWVGIAVGGADGRAHSHRGAIGVWLLSALDPSFLSPRSHTSDFRVLGLARLRSETPIAVALDAMTWEGERAILRVDGDVDGSVCTEPAVWAAAVDAAGVGPSGRGCVPIRAGETLGVEVSIPADSPRVTVVLREGPPRGVTLADGIVRIGDAPVSEVRFVIDEAHRDPERLTRALAGEEVAQLVSRGSALAERAFIVPDLVEGRRYRIAVSGGEWRAEAIFRAGRERAELDARRNAQ